MEKDSSIKVPKYKQRHFVARELQFSIALLIVLALLGGIFLQTVSSLLVSYFRVNTAVIGFFLILGYALIVVLLSIFFTHRLVGPFKRLEYEMKLVSSGELSKRLSIRTQDDLHVRNFIRYCNNFISNFEAMSRDYNKLSSAVAKKLDEMSDNVSKGPADCKKLQEEISYLKQQLHSLREKK